MSEDLGQRRPRTKSMLSFTGKNRMSLVFGKSENESREEKEAHKMHSKADPTKAINEAQPAAWSHESTTIEPLRAVQHKDVNGNIITDPDASNPTRSRLERPLDTIRAFEAAIDRSYSRRPMSRADSTQILNPRQRHSSYHPGPGVQQRGPVDSGGYYGNRMGSRPDSYIDTNGNSPVHNNHGRRFGPGHRVSSDPVMYGNNNRGGVYPSHGYQQSYDTVASASVNGSGATEQWGNSTDPSSENSSIDRVPQATKPDVGEAYGFSGFGGPPQFQGPILEEHGSESPAYGQPGYGQSHPSMTGGMPFQGNGAAPPAPPPHGIQTQSAPRVPIKLGGSGQIPTSPSSTTNSEKRKSWLKRRFSKN